MGIKELIVAENGISSFNLPRLGQTIGAQATRSTHPKTLKLFHELVSSLLKIDLHIITPFIWKTRADEIKILKESNCDDLLPITVSCNHSRRTILHPHCGTCSQCVDRRFATKYLDYESTVHIEESSFEKDIFTESLTDGEEWMQVESAVGFAMKINRMDIDSFYNDFVQVFDALDFLSGNSDENLQHIFKLHQQYANQITRVVGNEIQRNWQRLIQKELQTGSLLVRIFQESRFASSLLTSEQAKSLIIQLTSCPKDGKNKKYEEICKEILTFLFCKDIPEAKALNNPSSQSESDQGYERRDLVFQNSATDGFWLDIRKDYQAVGIVVDAKNYKNTITKKTIHDTAVYLNEKGLGMFGIVVARKIPNESKSSLTKNQRLNSTVKAQLDQWEKNGKMIIMLDDDDLILMINQKVHGDDPTSLIRERVFTVRLRV
jgi:hypothetical protein